MKEELKRQQLLSEISNSIMLRQTAVNQRKFNLEQAQNALAFEQRALAQLEEFFNRINK